MTRVTSIVLIGSGNVAHHMGKHLYKCGFVIRQVWSRTLANATTLAQELACSATDQLSAIEKDADLYILSVRDDALASVSQGLAIHLSSTALVVHTSGATSSLVLAEHFKRYGVFYPLQTFSKARTLDFTSVPLCLSAADSIDQEQLTALANALVTHSYIVDDEQRSQLHLAAIFVNNFTNYLQYVAQSIVDQHALPWPILQPLLEETVAKLQDLPAKSAQTGPAMRGDIQTQDSHLQQLAKHPAWAHVYQVLSERITKELGG